MPVLTFPPSIKTIVAWRLIVLDAATKYRQRFEKRLTLYSTTLLYDVATCIILVNSCSFPLVDHYIPPRVMSSRCAQLSCSDFHRCFFAAAAIEASRASQLGGQSVRPSVHPSDRLRSSRHQISFGGISPVLEALTADRPCHFCANSARQPSRE